MKANELMIGDWVYLHNGTVIEPKQVTGVLIPDCIYLDFGYEPHTNLHTISLVEPIPLTAEILERNGFVYDDLPMSQYFEQYGLQLYYGGNGFRINCGINVSLIIDSVHELQHAMRLCGIEKEIEL